MGVILYVYHMKDGFAYIGMLPDSDELKKKNCRTLVNVVIAPTGKLAGNYRENVTKEYNVCTEKLEDIKINLKEVQAECDIGIPLHK